MRGYHLQASPTRVSQSMPNYTPTSFPSTTKPVLSCPSVTTSVPTPISPHQSFCPACSVATPPLGYFTCPHMSIFGSTAEITTLLRTIEILGMALLNRTVVSGTKTWVLLYTVRLMLCSPRLTRVMDLTVVDSGGQGWLVSDDAVLEKTRSIGEFWESLE